MSKENELKARIVRAGIDRLELAEAVGVKYSTLSQYLNGYLPMPEDVRKRINWEIDKV